MKRSDASILKTTALCEWITEHAGLPYLIKAKNTEEYRLARWLSRRRYAVKKGLVLSEAEFTVLTEFGLTELYGTSAFEAHSLDMVNVYNEWVLAFGSEPRHGVPGLEGTLYRWKARKDGGVSAGYLADSRLLVQITEGGRNEPASNYMALSLCLWVKRFNKTPSRVSSDPTEKRLAKWLSNKRDGLNGNGPAKVYQSDKAILEEQCLGHLLK